MGDIRFERKGGFTVLPNATLRDPRLSLKTKGLFAVMYSLPDDWDFSIAGLAAINGVGKDAIRGALQEMEGAGYLVREAQSHGARGKFSASVYIIHEESRAPIKAPLSGFPTTVEPTTVEPISDEPSSENPTQLNKEELSKDLSNTPHNPPAGDGSAPEVKKARPRGKAADHLPERFEAFYRFYPHRINREAARRAWNKLRPDDALIRAMGRALKHQAAYWMATGTEQRHIPHPSTWLNQKRWTDPPESYPLPSRGGGQASSRGSFAPDPEVF